jgi:hypothetical protein
VRAKPSIAGCRLKTKDKLRFIEKCREQGKKPQEILESMILDFINGGD